MFSEKLEAFVAGHKPAESSLTAAQIRAAAEKAGFEVRSTGKYEDVDADVRSGQIMVVAWGELTSTLKRVKKSSWFGLDERWVDVPGQFARAHRAVILNLTAKISWSEKVTGGTVTFSPYLHYNTGGSFGPGSLRELCDEILAAAGIVAITVTLPEETVVLPRAPWDGSYAYDYGSGMVEDTVVCYRSEAQAIVVPFMDTLVDLAGILWEWVPKKSD